MQAAQQQNVHGSGSLLNASSPIPTASASLHLRLPAVSCERFVTTTCLLFLFSSFFYIRKKKLSGTWSAAEKR